MNVYKTLSGNPPRLAGWLSFLLSGWGVLVFWLVYGLAHGILRLNISHTLTIDDARANELVQNLSLGYQARQPPLYEWLLWCTEQVFGTGLASHVILRYALIAALGISCYGAVRAALKDARWAAVASISLAISYPVGWTFHEWATQTILLCIACFATLHATINWLERSSRYAALWLGLAVGFGLLSKFSYPLFLAGLLIAGLSMPETRKRFLDPRLLLSLAIALAMISPYLVWLMEVRGNVTAAIEHTLVPAEKPYLLRVMTGLSHLAKSIPLFLLPWVLFLMLFVPRAFGYEAHGIKHASVAERLTLRTMIAAAALAAIGIVLIGATNIAERYMHPILIVAPVYVFARIQRFDPHELSLAPLAKFICVGALAILCVRFVAVTDNGITRRADRLSQIPYETLAAALEARGIRDGTAVTFDVRDAGNLHAFLPELRVTAGDSFRLVRPPRRPSDDRSCILLYSAGQGKEAEKIPPFGNLTPERIDVSAPPSRLGAPRHGTWWIVRLDPKSPPCL